MNEGGLRLEAEEFRTDLDNRHQSHVSGEPQVPLDRDKENDCVNFPPALEEMETFT